MAAANETIIKNLLSELQVVAGVDTFTLRADKDLTANCTGIENIGILNECRTHGRLWKYKVNCDKISGGYNAAKFSDVIEIIKDIFASANVLEISRLDLRFDNFATDSYDNYYKLNSMLLSLIAYTFNYENRYTSLDPITGLKKSIFVQNKSRTKAIEYYNKQLQKPELGIGARLEFRDKKTEIDLLSAFNGALSKYMADWFEVMAAATEDKKIFEGLKAKINKGIANNYVNGEFITVAEYLAFNCLRIYDKQQARQICETLGKSSRNGDSFFSQRPQQQIISLADLKAYIEILRTAAAEFLLTE